MSLCTYRPDAFNNNRNDPDDDYCEIKLTKHLGYSLPEIGSLTDLIRELNLIFDGDKVNVDLVHYVMRAYKSNPIEWKKYAKFDRYRIILEKNFGYPPKIGSLGDLIKELNRIFENDNTNLKLVYYAMQAYKSNPTEWKKYGMFDRNRYTRNLVDNGNGKYNLMALCWGEGHGAGIHDHANSHCFMKMLQGSLEEVRYAWPKAEGEELKEIGRNRLKLNEVCYINDSLGLHRVENVSSYDTAISLHLYCPPYEKCSVFNQKNGKRTTATVTFYSMFGKRNKDNNEIPIPEDN